MNGSANAAGAGNRDYTASADTQDAFDINRNILSTIDLVRRTGSHRLLTSRAVRLPILPLESIETYDLVLPESCGEYAFRLYETGPSQILEYRHTAENGDLIVIRDYTAGPSPFIAPGLWTSYDHTSMEVYDLMSQIVRTAARIAPAVYSRGLVTSLTEQVQNQLAQDYLIAVNAAAVCGLGSEQNIAAR